MHSISRRTGYSIVELLVAIAIVSLLAAVFIPTVLQARERARTDECQSNMHKISFAILQYVRDYDNVVPPEYYCGGPRGEYAGANRCMDSVDTYTWVSCIHPYMKVDRLLFRCPDAEKDPYGLWSTDVVGEKVAYRTLPTYGYNYAYLTPEDGTQYGMTCPVDAGYADGTYVKPVAFAKIEAPGRTVLITDVKCVGSDATHYFPSWGADPPVTVNACYLNGWGTGSHGDDAAVGGVLTYTGSVDPRHEGGINVAFCDGHVRRLTPAQLAAGTNWHPGISNFDSNFKITDMSKNLWSLKKTGKSDL